MGLHQLNVGDLCLVRFRFEERLNQLRMVIYFHSRDTPQEFFYW